MKFKGCGTNRMGEVNDNIETSEVSKIKVKVILSIQTDKLVRNLNNIKLLILTVNEYKG